MKYVSLSRLIGRIARSNLQELPLPYRLTFAVTNRCQARCTMCNIWQKPVDDELTVAEIDRLFTKANRFSWINLTGGELFQRPDIFNILLTVVRRSRDLYLLNFPTNGIQTSTIIEAVDMVLRETRLPRLIVSVSIDGPASLHDTIRGVPGCWEQAVTTFRQLRERRSSRFSVFLGHTIQTANLGQFDSTFAACAAVLPGLSVDDFHLNLAHSSGHYYDNADRDSLPPPLLALAQLDEMSKQRSLRLLDPVSFIERRYHRHIKQYLTEGRVSLVCQAACASCFIDHSGTVYPCSVYNTPLGTLRECDMDLYRIWNSSGRVQIRDSIRNNACPGCWTPCEAYQTLLANLRPGKGRS
jgi:MoaA/NifB/PqqE/SkfB family radical SAM enzyme